ncbi:MAG: response regulator, partial [Bacilli bacterium]|nr:response regulator [Bacilli bacterium]
MSFIENLVHASDGIIASILYLFICLVTIIWLLVVYFNKKRKNSIRALFFKVILFTIITLLVSNAVVVFFLNEGIDGILFRIVYAIHWECFIWWFGTYRVYNLLFLSGDGEEEWPKQGGFKKLYTGLSISKKIMWNDIVKYLSMVIYLFLPFSMMDVNNLNFIQGINTYFVVIYMFASGGISLFEALITYKKETTFNKLSVVFVYAVMFVAIVCQYFVRETTVYCLCAAIQVYFLYFMVENPDIRLRKEIEDLKSGIEKSNKAKTDFLSNMSHEIRTPMNAIVGFSDSLLTSTDFDEKSARTDIENIYTAGNNLVDIINNILDISKIESEQNTINAKNCNLDKLVKELASVIKSRLGKKPIEFITELDEHIPSVIWGDSTKIYQILLNIANNSVKYTEVGKIKLSCIPETLDSKQVLLHFKISDTGYGIKKEDYDKVFKKYSRLDDATDNDIEGTGLGLVITKQFVELMGGKIWFSSDFEVGTTFFIDIPFKVIDDTPIGVQKEITSEKTEDGYLRHLDCSDYTVLIVDDNETNLKVATRLLSKYNFKIESAKNGKDCVYKFKYGNHYDMILLDDMMPEMDGVDTVKIIKKLDVFDIPPIVAFTANAMTGMGEKYLEAGFDYYLPMPVSVQELDELVTTYFGEKVKTYVEDKESFVKKETTEDTVDAETVAKIEKVSEVPLVEEKKEETKSEESTEEKKEEVSEVKEEPKSEESTEEKKEETSEVKEEPKSEESTEEKKEETSEVKEEPKSEESTEEKKEETSEVKEEPKSEEST